MTGNKVERIKKYIVGVHGFLVESDDDEEELVRCKDCMHSEPSMLSENVRCKLSLGYHEPDWYCPDGERKQSLLD